MTPEYEGAIPRIHIFGFKSMKPMSSPSITAEMAGKIRYLKNTKGLYNHQIAAIFGINQGRVSEVLTGKTFPNVPPAQGDLFEP